MAVCWKVSVSYTHLDVYKRQAAAIAEQQKSRVDPMYHEKIDHNPYELASYLSAKYHVYFREQVPVSYTHLDVYKRQAHPRDQSADFLLLVTGQLPGVHL